MELPLKNPAPTVCAAGLVSSREVLGAKPVPPPNTTAKPDQVKKF